MNQPQVSVDADLKPLIPMFLDNRRQDIAELKESLAKDDLATIEQIGHKLKGAGGGYGFDRVTELGRDIEREAKAGNKVQIEELIEELAVYMEEVKIIYE